MDKKEPTLIKDFPGQAVEAHLQKHGKLPGEEGTCSSCGLTRSLNDGLCVMCVERSTKTLVAEATNDAAVTPGTGGGDAPALETQPAASAEPHIVAEMNIKLLSDGNATIEGPLHNRKQVQLMLNVAHDLSYEYEKRVQEAQALADRPAPKKWSKPWWAEQFRRRAEERKIREATELARRDAAQRTGA